MFEAQEIDVLLDEAGRHLPMLDLHVQVKGSEVAMVQPDVLQTTMYVFGDRDTAEHWLQRVHPFLGESPVHASQHRRGLQLLHTLLAAIIDGTEP